MDMANSALQAVLREAGGARANLGAGSAPSSLEAFPERSRQARVPGQEDSQSRRDRAAGFRGGRAELEEKAEETGVMRGTDYHVTANSG